MKYMLILLLTSLLCTSGLGQSLNMSIENIQKNINAFPTGTQIAIAKIEGDKVEFIGVQKLDESIISLDNQDSVFEIGSISKVFTSSLLAHAVNQGKIQLEDPIQQGLPFTLHQSEKEGKAIRYIDLANHTSGLPRLSHGMIALAMSSPSNPYQHFSKKKLEEYLQEGLKLDNIPGEKYAYSNMGAGILAYLLSQKTGKSYGELLENQIFSPLGMQHSTLQREAILDRLVSGLDASGTPTSNWDFNSLAGAGGIYSTVSDLAKFAQANFTENAVFELQRKKTHIINPRMDIALGWHIIHTKLGDTFYWHNGGTGGYTSSMAINPKKKRAVIILSNVSAYHPQKDKIDIMVMELLK